MTVNPRVFEKNSKLKLSRYFSDNFKRSYQQQAKKTTSAKIAKVVSMKLKFQTRAYVSP